MRMGALVSALLFSACSPSTNSVTAPTASPEQGTDSASVMIDSVSYRHDRSMSYTLYDMSTTPPKAVGGSIVDRLASGGDKGCCLSLPTRWRPGLKVQVQWEEGDRERMYPEIHKRTLDIPRYTQPSDLYVVFYPEHEVEVVVSVGEPGHPDWAGRIKQTPWDYCVAQLGRKPCSTASPDPILQSLKESCPHVPDEPACKDYFKYCEAHKDEGACP